MYSAALALLSPTDSSSVASQITAWVAAGGGWRQVAVNVQAETAIQTPVFVQLLQSFCANITNGGMSPEDAWIGACRAHQRQGVVHPMPIPAVLGRAIPIRDYANLMSAAHGGGASPDDEDDDGGVLSPETFEAVLREEANGMGPTSDRQRRLIRAALIGRYLIWATFSAHAPNTSPFDHLPRTTDGVRTALGLGECSETETLILITYGTASARPPFDLHRPTVADAADYCWFRPCAAGNVHGWTGPLMPNPQNLQPQPEVVHAETTGATLIFPLYLVV